MRFFYRLKAIMGSLLYRCIRRILIFCVYTFQRLFRKSTDLEPLVLFGDRQLRRLHRVFPSVFYFPVSHHKLRLYDLQFHSPLTFAAFKDDLDILSLWLTMGIGGGVFKTIMLDPCVGNPMPRLQTLCVNGQSALLNAMGLPGKGVSGFCESLRNHDLWQWRRPLGFSVGGHSLAEYEAVFRYLFDEANRYYSQYPVFFELNISCPNTPDGQNMMKNPLLLDQLLQQLRRFSDSVIGVKLSPDLSNQQLAQFADIVCAYPRMYLNIGNTQYRSCEQVGLPRNAISVGGGGLSGKPLFPRTLDMLNFLRKYDVPLVATGGISSQQQIYRCMREGAVLVGVATALVEDPFSLFKGPLEQTDSRAD